MNTEFIVGSVAEVGIIFCYPKYIQPDKRGRMAPQLFEAICFLKENKRLFYVSFFVNAVRGARKQKDDRRICSHEAREQENGCMQ